MKKEALPASSEYSDIKKGFLFRFTEEEVQSILLEHLRSKHNEQIPSEIQCITTTLAQGVYPDGTKGFWHILPCQVLELVIRAK
jgi:hypothetical protein